MKLQFPQHNRSFLAEINRGFSIPKGKEYAVTENQNIRIKLLAMPVSIRMKTEKLFKFGICKKVLHQICK